MCKEKNVCKYWYGLNFLLGLGAVQAKRCSACTEISHVLRLIPHGFQSTHPWVDATITAKLCGKVTVH